jgi:3D-(3,5/4)-trihydroxycyclohexane-1,2-dione acylhydrolase (decyclizing)
MAEGQSVTQLTTAQAIVKYLQMQYSERDGERTRLIPAIFGIFGHGNVAGMGQALYEYGAGLTYMQPCNEQSMVHTAAGYARAMRRRATFACASSIGPGATNMVTGAALATINRIPVLLLPADYYATRFQGPVLQQLEHPVSFDVSVNDCLRPVSRFFDRISRPEQLLESLPEAMRVLTDPAETGAVTIALPQDVQTEAYTFPERFFDENVWVIERRLPDPSAVQSAIELLASAKQPMIIAGGGVHYSEAWQELQAFAELCGIPVGETFGGKGALREVSRLAMGGLGVTGNPSAAAIAKQADLIICVGTRLTDFATGSRSLFQSADVQFISVNVCARDAYKLGALPVVADAKRGLEALIEGARSAGLAPREEYLRVIDASNSNWRSRLEEVFKTKEDETLTQSQLLGLVNATARSGDIIVAAAGSAPADLHQMWDATGGRAAHLEFGFSCMGYEIPAALGVRMAQQDGQVYVLIGDGTYLMNPTELKTAVQEGLKIIILLVSNSGFQCIRRLQLNAHGYSFGNEFRARDRNSNRLEGDFIKIDFAQNAESFGARSWTVRTKDELLRALEEARSELRPCLISVEVQKYSFGPDSEVWWDVAPAEVSGDDETAARRTQYEAGRSAYQRYYGSGVRAREHQVAGERS